MTQQITFHNKIDEVGRVAALIENISEELNLPFALVSSLQLAIEEAMVNIINYAYPKGTDGTGTLTVTDSNNTLTFVLTDSGIPFDPTAKADPDITMSAEERPIGGLGIMLIKKIMDNVTYVYSNSHNILTMTKHY